MIKPPDQTFLFADMAGFTALTEAHGDEEAADLAGVFFTCVRRLLPEFGAQEIKTIGDAVMLRCAEPKAAVQLALAIVENAALRSHFPIVRAGMHTGPAVQRHGDWFGAAVNLAARVSGLAGGGEILLTEATREVAGNLAGIEFRHHGRQRFKNVQRQVEVYRALREQEEKQELPIDPVCRMAVHPGHEKGSVNHDGVDYHFCSIECVRAFVIAPGDYVRLG